MWLARCVRAWSSHFHSKNIASILPLRVSPSSANSSHKPSFANALATGIGLLRPCRTPNQVGPYGTHAIMVYCHLWGSKPCLSICLEVWQLSPCLSHMSIVHTWYYIILLRASIFKPFMVIASTMEVD